MKVSNFDELVYTFWRLTQLKILKNRQVKIPISNQIVILHEKIFKCQIEFKIEQTGSIQGVGERAPVHCNAWIGQLIWNKPATAQSYDSIYYSAVKMKSVAPSQIFKKRYRTNNYLINIYDL